MQLIGTLLQTRGRHDSGNAAGLGNPGRGALTAAQAQVGESDKRLATKADVTAVQVELAWVKKTAVGSTLSVPNDLRRCDRAVIPHVRRRLSISIRPI